MLTAEITPILLSALEQKGFKARIIPIQHLSDLNREIADLHKNKLLDQDLYDAYLDRFEFESRCGAFSAQSVIIVTAPQPQVRVTFFRQGRKYPCIVPPTYDQSTDQQIQDFLEGLLNPRGYHLEKRRLPQKMLAVRSGLAQYGRNNISYVPEMGSFHRPVTFVSDLPVAGDGWAEPRVLEACRDCDACRKACPTGAIGSDRFLLHAERCMTFHNEQPGQFASWLDASWHHCLVGCMICQKVCPLNKNFRKWVVEGPVFSEEETQSILSGNSKNEAMSEAVRKLEALDLIEYRHVLGRNLGVLLERFQKT